MPPVAVRPSQRRDHAADEGIRRNHLEAELPAQLLSVDDRPERRELDGRAGALPGAEQMLVVCHAVGRIPSAHVAHVIAGLR